MKEAICGNCWHPEGRHPVVRILRDAETGATFPFQVCAAFQSVGTVDDIWASPMRCEKRLACELCDELVNPNPEEKCPDCGNALTEVLVFFAAKPPTQRSLEPG